MACWHSSCRLWIAAMIVCGLVTGCHTPCKTRGNDLLHPHAPIRPVAGQPNESARVVMPNYVIEPPDVLMIDAIRAVPLPPYRIEPLDALAILVTETLPQQPIAGLYTVEPEGTINLGFTYGSVQVADKTIEEAKVAIENHLKPILRPGYQVTVSPGETRGRQQIAGPHLVRQDGKVSLGTYGAVPVAGLTIEQAKAAIELHLSQFLLRPEVSVDVAGFNSKVYYVITDGAGFGEGVYRQPITGNETVLDAVSSINGLPSVASKKRIWVARPTPGRPGCDQVLPVDWIAITKCGKTDTNYQVFPGDRIYVEAKPVLTFDNYLAMFLAPVERVMGVYLLGQSIGNGGNNQGGGF
jgi:polysaccharide export outer membrane protein